MTVAAIAEKMIEYSAGNTRDICHFLKVFAYAQVLGENEGLTGEALQTLEVAALLHDIACPLCRQKYGSVRGDLQEKEGMPLAADFLRGAGLPAACAKRVVWLVGHHHTVEPVDGADHQMLLEADYLVNAEEGHCPPEDIAHTRDTLFKTQTGIRLLNFIFRLA